MPELDKSWIDKWQAIIDRIGQLIAKEGREMVVLNVQAQTDVKKQFEKYQWVCESVKNSIDSVVTTSLPGEERIFWPYKDVQFYIREGDEKVHCTGNQDVFQQIFNVKEEPVRSDEGPFLEFWKNDKLIFQLDDFRYADNTQLFNKDFKLDLPALLEKYQFQQTKELEDKDNWYMLKFFFIASTFNNLEGTGDLTAGIPKGMKIKCTCDTLLDLRWNLKGFLNLSKFNFRYPYYLRISELCDKCGSIICIFRSKAMDAEGLFPPLRIFMNFLDPSWNYQIEDMQMIDAWQNIFQEAVLTNMEAVKAVYGNDIVKFGMFLERMHKKYKT